MNRKYAYLSSVLGTLLMLGAFAQGQEETTAEPLELTRLREQFQTRVDQELIPWRDKYKKELQKLEDRLIQERRLKEALVVKSEREANGGLSGKASQPETTSQLPTPDTAAEAKKILVGTVWLVYAAEDKKHETLLDVYHFIDSGNVFVMTSKRAFPWSQKSPEEIAIQYSAGDIKMNIDFTKAQASSTCANKDYSLMFSGKPKQQ